MYVFFFFGHRLNPSPLTKIRLWRCKNPLPPPMVRTNIKPFIPIILMINLSLWVTESVPTVPTPQNLILYPYMWGQRPQRSVQTLIGYIQCYLFVKNKLVGTLTLSFSLKAKTYNTLADLRLLTSLLAGRSTACVYSVTG